MAVDLDLTAVVPALEAAFGDRYGGYWLERRRNHDVMHVGVVEPTAEDVAAVAALTGGHRHVVTDAVAEGYEALEAAKEEIAASLDPSAGDFAVAVDVAANAVVVQTEGDGATAEAIAPDAARRGAARRAERDRAEGRRPGRPGRADRLPADPAAAVRIEPQSAIDLEPLGLHPGGRDSFPPHEAGLGITVAVGSTRIRCTTAFLFANAYFGFFGSTAGHCGRIGDGVVVGNVIVDVIRFNSYHSAGTVWADTSLFSLSARGFPGWPVVHAQATHHALSGVFHNSQMSAGLVLCFEGISSDGGNCGPVVRSNQVVCCDGGGHAYVYTCINHPPSPGDSGGPVYKVRGDLTATAAGILSSSVTINGATATCFSPIKNVEATLNSVVVLG